MTEPEPNPNPTSQADNAKAPRHPKAPKRNRGQKAADALFIEYHHLRGKSCRRIAELLAKERPYTLSFKQISVDINKLILQWQADAKDAVAKEKARSLQRLNTLEEELWDAWEKSKKDEMSRTMGKVANGGERDGDGSDAKLTDSVRKVNRDGDPAFTRQILEIHDRRAKLLGLDAPSKQEISGPGGSPIITAQLDLSDEAQEAILRRHFERSKPADDRTSSTATADTA